jgi:hypothetical protein
LNIIIASFQPLIFPESEARCLLTSLSLDLSEINPSSPLFLDLWKAVYRVVSAAIIKRPNSLVIQRIPNVLGVFRCVYISPRLN